jgi:MIP family channel proteins
VAEVIGTYILVLFGAGAVVAVGSTAEAAQTTDVAAALSLFGLAAIGLAFAFAIVVVIYAFGHVSGAHVNPAVTIALAAARKFPLPAVPVYVAAQFVGAILAALTIYIVFPNTVADEPLSLGATVPGVGDGLALIAEIAITFILLVVVMATATDERATPPAVGLAIGLTIGAGVIATLPVSGGSFNPARSLGPMIVAWDFPGWWVYIIGPIVGAVIGALLYDAVVRRGSPPEPVAALEERPKAP